MGSIADYVGFQERLSKIGKSSLGLKGRKVPLLGVWGLVTAFGLGWLDTQVSRKLPATVVATGRDRPKR